MTNTNLHNGELSGDFAPFSTSSGARNINARDTRIAPGEIAIGVVIGRASEHFDFFVYALASVLVFPALFFPFAPRLEGMLYAFAIFAFAFLARPLGTIAFLAIQRRYGREIKLTGALFLLGFSTAGIAFLPTYADFGIAAIVLLSLLRIGQGLALGGSWDGLPSLLALNAPKNRHGWYAMLGQLGAPVGFLLAAGLFAYLILNTSSDDFLSWGWRYPFYVAFAINVVAMFARLRLVSTKEYTHLLDERELEPTHIRDMPNTERRNVIIGAMAALASYALFHVVTIFPLSWITLYSTRSLGDVLLVQMLGATLMIFGVIGSGLLADRIGRRTTLGTLAVLIAVLSLFVPTLMGGSEVNQDAFILIGFILLGFSYGQASGATSSNFSSKYRYTGAALTSDVSWLTGAGFAPLVALGVAAHFGLAFVGIYLLSGAASSMAALSINRALEIRR